MVLLLCLLTIYAAPLLMAVDNLAQVVEHIEKISTVRKCSFISAASDIFNAKISVTFNRT